MVVGIDEVGRGAWAGPLVVGAVLLGDISIAGLTDSKLLSKKQRNQLDIEIRQKARAIGLGWVSAKQIDAVGLSEALKLASRRALTHIKQDYVSIIIDGTIALIDDPRVTLIKKADLLVPAVSAASIIAKVARDNYMAHMDMVFPGYTFSSHVGYGTRVHQEAINRLGVTPLHRLSFAPLAKYTVTNPAITSIF
jgi:ribonuclease HII